MLNFYEKLDLGDIFDFHVFQKGTLWTTFSPKWTKKYSTGEPHMIYLSFEVPTATPPWESIIPTECEEYCAHRRFKHPLQHNKGQKADPDLLDIDVQHIRVISGTSKMVQRLFRMYRTLMSVTSR